jgi:hypothetical protein
MIKKNWFWYLIIVIFIIAFLKDCGGEKIKTVTVIETVKVTDTFTNTVIQKVPKTVYIERLKTIKSDTIIYKEKADSTTIQANQYTTKLESNNATADLLITTSGELFDVQGTITYKQENKTTTITKKIPSSGAYLSAQIGLVGTPSYGVGLDFQIRKVIIGGFANYLPMNGGINAGVKIGFKL